MNFITVHLLWATVRAWYMPIVVLFMCHCYCLYYCIFERNKWRYATAMKYSTVLTSAMRVKDVHDSVTLLDSLRDRNTTTLRVNGQEIVSTFSLVEIYSAVVWHCSVGWLLCCVLFPVSFNVFFLFKIQHFLPGFRRKFLHQFPSTITFLIVRFLIRIGLRSCSFSTI